MWCLGSGVGTQQLGSLGGGVEKTPCNWEGASSSGWRLCRQRGRSTRAPVWCTSRGLGQVDQAGHARHMTVLGPAAQAGLARHVAVLGPAAQAGLARHTAVLGPAARAGLARHVAVLGPAAQAGHARHVVVLGSAVQAEALCSQQPEADTKQPEAEASKEKALWHPGHVQVRRAWVAQSGVGIQMQAAAQQMRQWAQCGSRWGRSRPRGKGQQGSVATTRSGWPGKRRE